MSRRMLRVVRQLAVASIPFAILSLGCSRPETVPPQAAEVLGRDEAAFASALKEPVAFALTTLPTSGAVLAGRTGAICYSHAGEEEWRYEVKAGDEIVAAPAVAPDSSTFLLTRTSLVAISIRGEVLWTAPVGESVLPAVVALGDGSAVVTSGANALVNVANGSPGWRFELPDGDTITAPPRVAGNSNIYVQGASRLYVIDMSGIPVWDRGL